MIRAAVAVIRKEHRVLVCQRRKDSRYGLKWEFPGGKLDPGESFLDCMKREVREELSIVVESYDYTDSQINRYADGGEFEVMYFFVSRFEGTPTNNVFEQIRWVEMGELSALDMLEGNKPVIARMVGTQQS
ncbi:MAG TPA: (deoxy)nucleoside triphosphate pyrophosphohydrolase [Bacteroidota bacterium]|nr:(deoxy)nucleoside triphosphate pyrophosphohydrolase [Bacteroidota bacterium]